MNDNQKKIGVYICHCGTNIAATVDVEAVCDLAALQPGVVVARHYKYMCSQPGQQMIQKDIQELGLDAVVEASCTPKMHEQTFRNAVAAAGLNPYLFEMVNIREHCSWITTDRAQATAKAGSLVAGGVWRAAYHQPLKSSRETVIPKALVVGGGIAGIHAALKLADAGYPVTLVEKEPNIGGRMAQFDKTFPTLDCAGCTLTPKTGEVARHPRVEIVTLAEVKAMSGYIGNFQVTIEQQPRFIDVNACTSCGLCSEACPVQLPSEFDFGMGKRKAVYRNFPQAIPSAYTIDKRQSCPARVACPVNCSAQGYLALAAVGKYREAAALIRETCTLAATMGRICHHPCESACVRGDYDAPVAIRAVKRFIMDKEAEAGMPTPPERPQRAERIAIVGSGPAGLAAAYDLARWGYGVTVFDRDNEPGGMLLTAIPRYRLPRQALAQDVAAITTMGVEFRLDVNIGKDVTLADLKAQGYNAILLAIGLSQSRSLPLPGVKQDRVLLALPFLKAVNDGQPVVVGKKVIVIGGGNVACDVARCARRLGAQVEMACLEARHEMPAFPWDISEAEEEDVHIHNSWGPLRILGEGGRVTGIELKRCTAVFDSQGRFNPTYDESVTTTLSGDTIILAIGQAADLGVLESSGVTQERGRLMLDRETLATSDPDVFACGDVVTGPGSAVQAMASGHTAARSIHAYLSEVQLPAFSPLHPERKGDLTAVGQSRLKEARPRTTMPTLPGETRLHGFDEIERGLNEEAVRAEALRCLACGACSECYQCLAACGANAIRHDMRSRTLQRDVGAIIVATGWDLFDPSIYAEYGYGRYPDVITSMQFERLTNSSGPTSGRVLRPSDGSVPKRVVFIQCVGSRDESIGRPFCSQVCCMASVKHATLFKHQAPDGQAYMFYIDLRAVGKGYEEFVRRSVEQDGHQFIRGRVSKVYDRGGQLIVRAEDTLLGAQVEVEADLIVLAAGVSAREDGARLARTLGLTTDATGFLLEAHPKLKPVESNVGGIFMAGMCQGPKDISASIAQAGSAAAEALVMLVNGQVTIEPTVAQVDERLCTGCKTCVGVCTYSAVGFDEGRKVSVINSALCQGCGACAAACPTEAIAVQHFTSEQIFAQIEGILSTTQYPIPSPV